MFKVGDIVRFKTKEEFIKEHGKDWRNGPSFGFAPNMDFMLGKGFEVMGVIEVPFDDSTVFSIEGHSDIKRTYVSNDMLVPLSKGEKVEMLEGYKTKETKFKVGDKVQTSKTSYCDEVVGEVVYVEPFPREDDDMIYLVHSKDIEGGVNGLHMASPYSPLAEQGNTNNYWYTSKDLVLFKEDN